MKRTRTMVVSAYETCFNCKGSGLQDGMNGPVGCWECNGDCVIRVRDERGRFTTKLVPIYEYQP